MAIHKARRVMDEGGLHDKDEASSILGDYNTIDQMSEHVEDQLVLMYHKAMQTIEDPNGFEGPVFPYVSKVTNEICHSNPDLKKY